VLVKPYKRSDVEAMLQKWARDIDTGAPTTPEEKANRAIAVEEPEEPEELEELEELEEVEEVAAEPTEPEPATVAAAEPTEPEPATVAAAEPTEPESADPLVILDESNLVETFFGNKEVVSSLLARFIERTEQEIALIPDLIKKEDWETAQREAHTIKGSALNLSARQLGEAAAQLEGAIKNRDTQAIATALPLLAPAFKKFRQAAQRFIQSQTGGA
jgi:HPt (histidine-containing phosphotransfer) domain-containing protein